MTIQEQKQLSSLLSKYMDDLMDLDTQNHEKLEKEDWNTESGIKSQFNHARCIKSRIDVDIERNMSTL